ncbi:MAG: hypothetical protein U5K54_25655 [Cytophagales bacterium]|nr:hypothetical protein [Cytophagales bacterium]
MIHLVSIPVTNTSVNPARSTGQAIFAGGGPLSNSGCFGSLLSSWRCSRVLFIKYWKDRKNSTELFDCI